MNETPGAIGELSWHRSSYSGAAGGECVEVASCRQAVRVRDSKDTGRPSLAVGPATWSHFIGFVDAGSPSD
ncbi:DUF397 domain-containing protein [Streptomyces sp. NPDC008150]|uniref:DUF397 domain-containing protein n=1 Tax=Streptomyces sp. NPDC008150 TaxID=3364816 RepID=UPI0036EF585C